MNAENLKAFTEADLQLSLRGAFVVDDRRDGFSRGGRFGFNFVRHGLARHEFRRQDDARIVRSAKSCESGHRQRDACRRGDQVGQSERPVTVAGEPLLRG